MTVVQKIPGQSGQSGQIVTKTVEKGEGAGTGAAQVQQVRYVPWILSCSSVVDVQYGHNGQTGIVAVRLGRDKGTESASVGTAHLLLKQRCAKTQQMSVTQVWLESS